MLEEVFLRDILENPDDDAVRLIYADWLMERGDPRGEFIHVQCQLARSEGPLADWEAWADLAARQTALRQREKELLERHGEEWARPIRRFATDCEFRRGFVETVAMTVAVFVGDGEELFRRAPVQRVRFTAFDGTILQLAACPHLQQVRGLDFSARKLRGWELPVLLSSAHLTRLRSLELAGCPIDNPAAQALAESPLLAQLTHLDLSNTQVTVDGVRTLLQSRYWKSMQSLNLTGIEELAASERATLSNIVEGIPDDRRLETMLQLCGPAGTPLDNAHTRRLAQRIQADSDSAETILGEGLSASHRRERAAAAQIVGEFRDTSHANLPALVRRLHDRRLHGRDLTIFRNAATALVRLLPTLPREMRGWLCILANPLRSAADNLQSALESGILPEPVWDAFAALCVRRSVWWNRVRGETMSPFRVPVYPDHFSLWDVVCANQHHGGPNKEAAWLLARLCELLQRHLSEAPAA
jgi:uncharacterized protein (TIGR02996 family)